ESTAWDRRQLSGARPIVRVLVDWFSLNLVLQAVIWPLRLIADWPLSQTLWIDAALAGWSLLAGLLVAWGCRSNRGGDRTAVMLLCMLIVLGEPAALAVLGAAAPRSGVHWVMRISPVQTLYHLTAQDPDWMPRPWTWITASVAGAAVA